MRFTVLAPKTPRSSRQDQLVLVDIPPRPHYRTSHQRDSKLQPRASEPLTLSASHHAERLARQNGIHRNLTIRNIDRIQCCRKECLPRSKAVVPSGRGAIGGVEWQNLTGDVIIVSSSAHVIFLYLDGRHRWNCWHPPVFIPRVHGYRQQYAGEDPEQPDASEDCLSLEACPPSLQL